MPSYLSRSCARVCVVTLLLATVAAHAGDKSSQPPTAQQQRIEIVIQDKTFFLANAVPIQVGQSIELIVRNEDQVRHGFASASLLGLLVSGEDDQIMTDGKGVRGAM